MPVSWDVSPVVRCNMSFFLLKGDAAQTLRRLTFYMYVSCLLWKLKKKKKLAPRTNGELTIFIYC